jgi:hypothetical protein
MPENIDFTKHSLRAAGWLILYAGTVILADAFVEAPHTDRLIAGSICYGAAGASFMVRHLLNDNKQV